VNSREGAEAPDGYYDVFDKKSVGMPLGLHQWSLYLKKDVTSSLGEDIMMHARGDIGLSPLLHPALSLTSLSDYSALPLPDNGRKFPS
jgi:hypothetical protein